MKNVLVVGLGRFGLGIAKKLREMGYDVLAVDRQEERAHAALPYVDAVLGDGYNVPAHPLDSLVLQQSNGVKVVMKPNGNVEIESSPSKITLTSSGISVESPTIAMKAQHIGINGGAMSVDGEGNIQLCGGGPAIARVGDAIECPHGTGRITGGSRKATCG